MHLQATWMRQEGGRDLKDLIQRLMKLLLSPELQLKLNRTGTGGKTKFPEKLEQLLYGENIVINLCTICQSLLF